MKKLLLLLFCMPLLAIASNWVFVGESKAGNSLFIDTQWIQRSGNEVTLWERMNYSKRNKYGDLSTKVQVSINCRTREIKYIYYMFYSDLDNNGSLTYSSPNTDSSWQPIAPDTLSESEMQFVCSRR